MRLTLCAFGRMRQGPEREMCEHYAGRAEKLGRALGFSGPQLREFDESGSLDAAARARREAELFAAATPDDAQVVLFDETGRHLTSADFAQLLRSWQDRGVRECLFWLGGAEGHCRQARERADVSLCFGRMTWPHLLARAMACEQIYRAMTILAGHPYHRQ